MFFHCTNIISTLEVGLSESVSRYNQTQRRCPLPSTIDCRGISPLRRCICIVESLPLTKMCLFYLKFLSLFVYYICNIKKNIYLNHLKQAEGCLNFFSFAGIKNNYWNLYIYFYENYKLRWITLIWDFYFQSPRIMNMLHSDRINNPYFYLKINLSTIVPNNNSNIKISRIRLEPISFEA